MPQLFGAMTDQVPSAQHMTTKRILETMLSQNAPAKDSV
jgi:hypothetical protein